MGYLIGRSIVVSDAAAYKSANGKLNFWRHYNKSVVVFDSIKTHSVGVGAGLQLNSFSILKLYNRR